METIKFEGQRYTRAPKVVVLPEEYWQDDGKYKYMTFGVECDITKKGSVLTKWKNEQNFYIHALPIPFVGHAPAHTNLMYGKDNRLYLCLEGKCYSAPMSKKK